MCKVVNLWYDRVRPFGEREKKKTKKLTSVNTPYPNKEFGFRGKPSKNAACEASILKISVFWRVSSYVPFTTKTLHVTGPKSGEGSQRANRANLFIITTFH
jgi:hypothetical protein